MFANYIQIQHIANLAIENSYGDIAEFGVGAGYTFSPLAELAKRDGRIAHAILADSPFLAPLQGYEKTVIKHAGPYPGILNQAGHLPAARFAFVHLNLDDYEDTANALDFIWQRMAIGGYLICHGWQPSDLTDSVTKAIKDWMDNTQINLLGSDVQTQYCWFRR